jgi:hypothetical protein
MVNNAHTNETVRVGATGHTKPRNFERTAGSGTQRTSPVAISGSCGCEVKDEPPSHECAPKTAPPRSYALPRSVRSRPTRRRETKQPARVGLKP